MKSIPQVVSAVGAIALWLSASSVPAYAQSDLTNIAFISNGELFIDGAYINDTIVDHLTSPLAFTLTNGLAQPFLNASDSTIALPHGTYYAISFSAFGAMLGPGTVSFVLNGTKYSQNVTFPDPTKPSGVFASFALPGGDSVTVAATGLLADRISVIPDGGGLVPDGVPDAFYVFTYLPPNLSLCDVNQDTFVDVRDVQFLINQARGGIRSGNDVNQDGVVNVVDIQTETNWVLYGCPAAIKLTMVDPNLGNTGQMNYSVVVTGQATHWVQGVTTASFGAGITVASLTINSANSATAVLNIDPAAVSGPRNVTFTTGAEVAALNNAFYVTTATISSVSPNTGQQGVQGLGGGGPIFLTGHDPDWHVLAGSNVTGAAHINQAAIQFVTNPAYNSFAAAGIHKFLFVTSLTPPGGIYLDTTNGLIASGFVEGTDFDRADASILPAALGQLGITYNAIVVASDFGGILTQAELDILDANSTEIIAFLNRRGGLCAMAETTEELGGLASSGYFGFLPFVVTSIPQAEVEGGNTLTAFGLSLGLVNGDINGNFSHNSFGSAGGMTIVDTDPAGEILTLATTGNVTPAGVTGVVITGSSTHFVQDVTTASFGAGITVTSLTVNSASSALAVLNIDPTAAVGTRDVTLTSGTEIATLKNGFTVTAGAPTLTLVYPASAQVGQQNQKITVIGQSTHWAQGTTAASFGAGVTVVSLTIYSATAASAVLNIDPAAAVGSRNLIFSTGAEVATLTNGFMVAGIPLLTVVSPNAGQQSQDESVNLTGQYTHWVQGTTTAAFGGGTAASYNVTVPGIADLWLAGQPAGVILGGDAAPLNSPVLAWTGQNPAAGSYLTFAAMGMVDFGNCQSNSPDGDGCGVYVFGPASGISAITVPANALIGVFVNAGSPGGPLPDPLDFTTTEAQEQTTFSPLLNQVFFIGDGLTGIGDGSVQQFMIPAGATQLYLGSSDGTGGNYNNQGQFKVVVSDFESVAVTGLTVNSPTSATATVHIDSGAALGARDVTVTTGTEVVTMTSGFTVTPGPQLLSIAPNSALAGQANLPVTITGQLTHFTNASTIGLGPGITLSAVSATDATHLSAKLTVAGNGNLVQNGSLEDLSGFFLNTSLGYMSLSAGATTIAGWTVTPSTTNEIVWAQSPTADQQYGADGTYFVDLTGFGSDSPNGGLTQQLQNLISGQQYTFSMDTLVDNTQPVVTVGSVTVALTPGQPFQTGITETWAPQTGTFVADSTSPVLTIANQDPSQSHVYIDNIAIAVPGAAPLGSRNLTVSTGTEVESLINAFAINGTPVAISVTPASGAEIQTNVPVTITGQYTHFSPSSVVTFSGTGVTAGAPAAVTATSVTVLVTITAGAALGTRQVQVQTGAETVSLPGAYTVTPPIPVLTLVSPNTGPQAQQNESVSVTGQYTHWVQGSTTASFGPGVTVVSLTVNSATSATAVLNIAPAAAVGANNVTFTTGAEVAILISGFTVGAGTPALTLLSPNTGPQGQQSERVNVTGQYTNWVQGVTTASFGPGTAVATLTINSPTSATALLNIAPAAALGANNVTFTTYGEVDTLNNGFTVTPDTPAVTLLNPNFGQQGQQSESVSITGQFTHWVQGTTTASFGPGITVATLTINSATSATAVLNIAPAAALGADNVTFTSGTEVITLNNGFMVNVAGPEVTAVTPNTGSQGQQSESVSVTGRLTNWVQGVTTASFGAGVTVATLTINSATTATAVLNIDPAAATGANNVTLTTGAEAATLNNGFTVTPDTPVLTLVSPNTGQLGQQNLSVTLTGQFTHWVQDVTTVSFGPDISVNGVTVTGATSLTALVTIPANAQNEIVVADPGSQAVLVYDLATGALIDYGGVPGPGAATFGPDGNFYVTSFYQGFGSVPYYNGRSGALMGAFVTVGSGNLIDPTFLVFGPDGNLYISDSGDANVKRYNGTTGAFLGIFTSGGTINQPEGLVFGPAGSLYLADQSKVLKFNGATGAFIGVVATNGDTLNQPEALTFGPDGNLYVAGYLSNNIVRYNGSTGAFMDVFVPAGSGGLSNPNAAVFGPDGNLYVSSQANGVLRYSGATGAFIDNFLPAGLLGISAPNGMAFATLSAAMLGGHTVTATTGTEVVSLSNGFTVTPGTPVVLTASPNTGQAGQQNFMVTVAGQFTHFAQGASTVSFGGAGVTVNSVTVASATSLTASISLALGATGGLRTVTVTTGSEIATLANAFFVQAATNQPPVITIAPAWSLTLPGQLTLTYTVTDDGLPAGGGLTVAWNVVSGPGNVTFQNQTLTSASAQFDQAGIYVLQLGASDTQLITTQNVTVTVTGTAVAPPTLSISSPADGASVTTLTGIMGSVSSPALASWTLEFHMQNESTFRPLATGTAAVTNSLLGTFDPTLLLNGLAVIQLRATDAYGQTSIFGPISLVVTGSQKVGIFTLSFNDLTVPVAGLPIQVVRTYDSRNKAAGDFGVGWRLDLTTVTIAVNGPLGDNWGGTKSGGFLPSYCVLAADTHVVSVTFADGTVFQFQPALSPACQQLTPISQVSFGFSPISTTPPNASLSIAGNNQAAVYGTFPGDLTLQDPDTGLDFNPTLYSLTMPNGSVLIISASSGLQSLTDPNGNTLTITANGIIHSSGKSVSFLRGQGGQILQVTDPNNNNIVYGYDASNDLASVTDAAGNVTTFTYDGNHGLLTIVDPNGAQPVKNVYDANGRLTQHVDAYGNVVNFNDDLSAQQQIVTDQLGNVTANYYDASGNIVQITNALGGNTTRTYDANNNLLTEANPLNETLTYTYDANNDRLTNSDALGNQTVYTYNSLNQVLTRTDALGRVSTDTYDANGNILSAQDAAGAVTTYTYSSSGLQLSKQDALGGATSYQYDGAGNMTQQTDALGHIAAYTYDANGNKLTETKTRTTSAGSESLLTGYQYDALNRLTQTTFPDGSTTGTQYNSIGKQSMTTDQLGRQTSYTYDLMARLTQTTYPDGASESSTYDAEGHRITSTDRGGRTTTYQYDALGRLTKTAYADGTSTTTGYDAAGEVQSVTDALGNKTQYAYDAAGHRTKVTDALGNATSYTYDAVGNQTSMTDANGHMTQYLYDGDNRRTTVTYPDGTTDITSYDALGRASTKTDPAGKTIQFGYDALGQLTQVTDAKGQITSYTYDEVGNRVSQTDTNGHTTAFAYDKLGHLTKRTLPLSMPESFTYDSAGNMNSHTDFNGKTTAYTYDNLNRVIKKSPDASFAAPNVIFTYTATGQRQSLTDASGGASYTYDLRDRLLTKATPRGTLTYTYDPVGDLTSIRSSNTGGTSVNYTYDADKRLSIVKDNRLSAGATTYTYDGAGNLAEFDYPNSLKTTYTYNTLNRLTSLTVTAGTTAQATYGYTLGPAGNRTAVSEPGGRQVSYTYDELYRLTGETISGGSVNGAMGYQYDPVGNRLNRTSTVAPVSPATSTYDANDRLTTDTYDANGNTTASASDSYTYDFENHLATQNGNGAVMVYDGDGNRVSKTAGGVTTLYLVDDRNLTGYAQVLEEVAGGTAQRVYTYGLNRISQSQSSGTSFYGYDGRGSVRFLMDSTGSAITDRYDYDAFGNVLSKAGTTPNVYLFSGEQLDSNSGLYYMRARYLSSISGRFWTTDPWAGSLTDPASLHKYSYGRNDPVNRTDPSGRQYAEVALDVAVLVSFGSLPSADTTVFHSIFAVNNIAHCCIDPAAKLQNVALELIANGGPDWAYDLYNMATQTQAQGYQMIAETLGLTYQHVLDEVLHYVGAPRIASEILLEAGVTGLPGYKADLEAFLGKLDDFTQAWSALLTGASKTSECDDTAFISIFGGAYFEGVIEQLVFSRQ